MNHSEVIDYMVIRLPKTRTRIAGNMDETEYIELDMPDGSSWEISVSQLVEKPQKVANDVGWVPLGERNLV